MKNTLHLFLVVTCALQTHCGLNQSESLLDSTISIFTDDFNISSIIPVIPSVTQKPTEKTSVEAVRFFLVLNNSNRTNDTQNLFLEEPASIINSDFLVDQPVKILIHGFNSGCTGPAFPTAPLQGYLEQKKKRGLNVICVDWSAWSKYSGAVNAIPTYLQARSNYTLEVANRVAKLIVFFRDAKMVQSFSDVHLIGHSLGAHVSGATGFKVAELTGEKVGRISGLDPAGPLYRFSPDLDEQLDKSDAEFVDVYHTSIIRAGLEGKYGHIDFYPNGAVRQPSCLERRMSKELSTSVTEVVLGDCSHSIVANYWADSIGRSDILACKAESYAQFKLIEASKDGCNAENQIIFGENCPNSARGKYYLDLDSTYTA